MAIPMAVGTNNVYSKCRCFDHNSQSHSLRTYKRKYNYIIFRRLRFFHRKFYKRQLKHITQISFTEHLATTYHFGFYHDNLPLHSPLQSWATLPGCGDGLPESGQAWSCLLSTCVRSALHPALCPKSGSHPLGIWRKDRTWVWDFNLQQP